MHSIAGVQVVCPASDECTGRAGKARFCGRFLFQNSALQGHVCALGRVEKETGSQQSSPLSQSRMSQDVAPLCDVVRPDGQALALCPNHCEILEKSHCTRFAESFVIKRSPRARYGAAFGVVVGTEAVCLPPQEALLGEDGRLRCDRLCRLSTSSTCWILEHVPWKHVLSRVGVTLDAPRLIQRSL